MDAEELLKTVADEDVRAFLNDILREDTHYAKLFLNKYGPIDLAAALATLDNDISLAARRHADRHGFIHYRAARDFGWDWRQALATAVDPLLDRRAWDVVVALVFQALKSVWSVRWDDSGGVLELMLLDMRHDLERALDQADASFGERLIVAACDFLDSPPTQKLEREVFDLQSEAIETFLFKRFGNDIRYASIISRFAKMRLDQVKADYDAVLQEEGDKSWNLRIIEHSVGRWATRLLHARKLEGATVWELVEVAGDEATIEDVCIMLQAEARKQGDVQLALELLERTRQRYLLTNGSYPLRVSEQLAELLSEGDVNSLREELLYQMNFEEGFQRPASVSKLWPRLRETYEESDWLRVRDAWAARLTDTLGRLDALESDGRYGELMDEAVRHGNAVLHRFEAVLSRHCPDRLLRAYLSDRASCPTAIERLWEQVKAACPQDDWPALARELISLIPDPDKRMEWLAKECMFDDLMSEVEKAGPKALPTWREALQDRYPDRVLQVLVDGLLHDDSLRTASRKSYAEFCDRVIALRQLPGGDEATSHIVEETKRRYPNRKALHQELKRVVD